MSSFPTNNLTYLMIYWASQNRYNPFIWWFITETSTITVIWNMSCKKCILWVRYIKSMFFNCNHISFQDMQSFFEFLVTVINHHHINGLHLLRDSFEWFCLQISSDSKYFSLLSMALWSRIDSSYSILFSNLKQKRIQHYYQ